MLMPVILGAAEAMVSTATGTEVGVRSIPLLVPIVGKMVMVPATVPV